MADQAIPENGFGLPYIVKELIADVALLKGRTVLRTEHELRWKHDDERFGGLKDSIEDLTEKVDALVTVPNRLTRVEQVLDDLPGKLIRNMSAIVGIAAAIVSGIVWLIAHVGR